MFWKPDVTRAQQGEHNIKVNPKRRRHPEFHIFLENEPEWLSAKLQFLS